MQQRGSPLGESFFMPKSVFFWELSADGGVFFFDSIKFLSPKYPIKKAYKINLFKENLVLNKVDFW